jgi:hypothetical protein
VNLTKEAENRRVERNQEDFRKDTRLKNKKDLWKNIFLFKTILLSTIVIGAIIILQEVYVFIDGNETVHFFLDSGIVFKCERGFYSIT